MACVLTLTSRAVLTKYEILENKRGTLMRKQSKRESDSNCDHEDPLTATIAKTFKRRRECKIFLGCWKKEKTKKAAAVAAAPDLFVRGVGIAKRRVTK